MIEKAKMPSFARHALRRGLVAALVAAAILVGVAADRFLPLDMVLVVVLGSLLIWWVEIIVHAIRSTLSPSTEEAGDE